MLRILPVPFKVNSLVEWRGCRSGFVGRQGLVERTRSWIRKNSGGGGVIRLNSCESSYNPIPGSEWRTIHQFPLTSMLCGGSAHVPFWQSAMLRSHSPGFR